MPRNLVFISDTLILMSESLILKFESLVLKYVDVRPKSIKSICIGLRKHELNV